MTLPKLFQSLLHQAPYLRVATISVTAISDFNCSPVLEEVRLTQR
jgi:hypothetical protein